MRMAGGVEVSDEILAFGGFADLRLGIYEGRFVAVKTTRVAAQDDLLRIRKVNINVNHRDAVSSILFQRFYKEVVLWSMLSHPNILGLVGVQEDIKKRQISTVSEWMPRGNIMEYVVKNHTNRLELVRRFTFLPLPSLNCDDSCTGRLRV